MMRPAALLIAVVAVLSVHVALGAPVNLSGDWYFDVKSQNGPGRRDVVFRQEGTRVIGFIDSDSASGRFVGSLVGRNLEFTAVLEFGGQPMAAVYRAIVEGDDITGTIDFGDYGRATFSGKRGRRPPAIRPGSPVTIEGSARGAGLDVATSGEYFGVARGALLLPEMIAIPAGSFRMGNAGPAVEPEYGADFIHVHPVEISALRISRFLVTNAQYGAYVSAMRREPLLPPRGWDDYLTRYPNHPVVNVNYADATAYTEWLATETGEPYRLPTEAEWEYAARGGVPGRNFVFGDEWQVDAANIAVWRIGRLVDRDGWKNWWDNEGERLAKSRPMTTRVGSFAPNGFGLYDMVGNVWQWTQDWYRADYYRISPLKDPTGPAAGEEKVLRGCSWYNQPDVCFVATRDRYAPDRRLYYNGFRVVAAGVVLP